MFRDLVKLADGQVFEKTLIFYPTKRCLGILRDNSESFVSIDEDLNVTYYEKGELKKITALYEFACVPFSLSEIEYLYSKLDYYAPVFSRWEHKGYEHELIKEDILTKIMQLSRLLQDLNITRGIFLTSCSHHLDTFTFELALSFNNIPQIFLYAESLTGRLLPFKQVTGIKDRIPLDLKISEFRYDTVMSELGDRKRIQPNYSQRVLLVNFLKQNVFFCLIYLIVRKARQLILRGYYSKIWNEQKYRFTRRIGETLFSDIDMIRKQRGFLRAYDANSLNVKSNNFQHDGIVLMAHLQPEATSFPEGGRVHSHVAIVSHIRELGYEAPIFYKEHWASRFYLQGGHQKKLASLPSRVGMYRDKAYCKRLVDLDCQLLPMSTTLKDDMRLLAITISGSIAIERSLRGLVTVYTGTPYWEGLPGTKHISELGNHFIKIPEDWLVPCPKIAKKSQIFLLNLLNEKTIYNEIGIGLDDKISPQPEFLEELKRLMKKQRVIEC